MRDMLQAYTEWGLTGLAEEIKRLDAINSPHLQHSRLILDNMTIDAVLLLAQVSQPMLLSILNNRVSFNSVLCYQAED